MADTKPITDSAVITVLDGLLADGTAISAKFATKTELAQIEGGEGNLPAGGTTGQIATKASDDSFDVAWVDPPDGGASSWDEISDKPTFADVATSGDYDDLSGKPTLGTAATADTDDFATPGDVTSSVANAPVRCIWDDSEEEWVTAAGGALPTDPALHRQYRHLESQTPTTPTPYGPYDDWDVY